MKSICTLVLVFCTALAFGQTKTPATTSAPAPTVNFCGQNIEVAGGCASTSPYQVKCDKYEITWMYMDYAVMRTAPEEFARQMKKEHKKTDMAPFECYIAGKPAKGYKLSYMTEAGGIAYQLIVSGVASGQPVLVQLTLDIDPYKNEDIPALPRQIVQLSPTTQLTTAK
ncbi:hypothetical protein SAMN00120144_3788 [Hymenobacter roseosalivarius DSM 11622]|uniref:PrcB C-terminal domain-containing protein n=2 Tax=Hymenobacter roseosalivarius TaxID=89967 RepID=A0A1W1W1K5_9BACT|nr:hypothetical protein SAMN00120144_3788 [Hymenobacter roseosalivarius DSM 11622]